MQKQGRCLTCGQYQARYFYSKTLMCKKCESEARSVDLNVEIGCLESEEGKPDQVIRLTTHDEKYSHPTPGNWVGY